MTTELTVCLFILGLCPPLFTYVLSNKFRRWVNRNIHPVPDRDDENKIMGLSIVFGGMAYALSCGVATALVAILHDTFAYGSPFGFAIFSVLSIFPFIWMKKQREAREAERREALRELSETALGDEDTEIGGWSDSTSRMANAPGPNMAQGMNALYGHQRVGGVHKDDISKAIAQLQQIANKPLK